MSDETREALAEYLAPYCGFSKEMRDWPRLARRAAGELADAVLSSGLVVPAAIHKVATDALEAGDACGAVGCRALAERDAAWERAETAEREWRDGWADWISNGASAAGLPEPFTLDTVIGWLRSDRTPFGCSSTAALDTTPRA